jgi:hypothetical protein
MLPSTFQQTSQLVNRPEQVDANGCLAQAERLADLVRRLFGDLA